MDRPPQGYIGVDEAGRGPVLGPMVVAAVAVNDLKQLPDGIADSKQLSPKERVSIANQLRENRRIQIGIEVVPPIVIDLPGANLNSLTIEAMVEVADRVASPNMVGVFDAGSPNPDAFAAQLQESISSDIDVVAEHQADANYSIVGAASIIAKVERDQRITALREKYGSVGSGYPSDPTTRQFIQEFIEQHGHLPSCARASWKTSQDLLSSHSQEHLSEYSG